MIDNIKLLPLPEGEASSFGDYQVYDDAAMIEYARANVAFNTALLRAEVEALRAEVAEWKARAAIVRNAALEEAAEEADRWQTALHDPRYECDCATAIRALKK